MSNKNEREYRSMMLAVEERAEDEPMIVSGYASTFDEPYRLYGDDQVEVWEKVDRNAFDETDMSDVILQFDHAGRVFARVRNKTLQVSPDDTGLYVRADLSGTDLGRGLYQDIAGGYIDRMSFGFTVDEDTREIVDDRTTGKSIVTRTITKVGKLYDVSAVSLPANPGTSISARFLDGAIEEARAERLKAQELREKREQIMKRAEALGKVEA